MSCLIIMNSHGIVRVSCANGSFMLPESVLESSFGSPNIKKSTGTFKTVHQKRSITVGKMINLVALVSKYIHKPVCFRDILAVAAVATGKVTHRLVFVKPGSFWCQVTVD